MVQFLPSAFENDSTAIQIVDEVIETSAYEVVIAADNFEEAFQNPNFNTSYNEVQNLMSTNLVDHLFYPEKNENNTSVAEGLLSIFGGKSKPCVIKENWSEKKKAKRLERHAEIEKIRANFVEKWESKLNYIGGWVQITEEMADAADKALADNPLLASMEYCAGYELEPSSKIQFGSKQNRKIIQAGKGLPNTSNLGELILCILVKATEKLSSKEKIDLVIELDKLKATGIYNTSMSQTEDGLSVVIEDYLFNLGDATITRIEKVPGSDSYTHGRVRKAIKVIVFNSNFVVSGDVAIFVWILNSMRLSTKGMSQAINMSSNFFEETVNYGATPGSEDIAYHVNKNMLKEAEISLHDSVHFPYSNLSNKKLAVSTLQYVLDRGVHAICDKQNKSWITINSGAESLFVGRDDEGHLINLNDMSKPTKLFNRPAACRYSFAELL